MAEHIGKKDERGRLPLPPLMQLSAERLVRHGLFLLASATSIYIFVCEQIHPALLQDVFGVADAQELPLEMVRGKRFQHVTPTRAYTHYSCRSICSNSNMLLTAVSLHHLFAFQSLRLLPCRSPQTSPSLSPRVPARRSPQPTYLSASHANGD